jgi:hypothetical protein
VRKSLAPAGSRIALADNTIDVWLRAALPKPAGGYDSLGESTLLGVISFAKDSKDYKGQRIAAGIYTMRYELQPANGDHLGTAPTRDFVLLLPVASDADPAAVLTYDQMVTLSKRASGSNHPLPLNLLPSNASAFPSMSIDDEGRDVFNAKLKTVSGELPMALVVRGTAPQ